MNRDDNTSVEQPGRVYTTPELTTYGSIDKLTEMATSGALLDGARTGSK